MSITDITIIFYLSFAIFVVKILSDIFRFKDYMVILKKPKTNIYMSILVMSTDFVFLIFNCLVISQYISGLKYVIVSNSLTLAPMIFVCYYYHDSLKSIGITSKNLLKSLLLAFILVAGLIFVIYFFIDYENKDYNLRYNFYLLSGYLITGFSEEILFRGYLQTRMIILFGRVKGIIITIIIFSLFHLPNMIIFQGLNFYDAFIQSIVIVPVTLLFSYIMFRSKNIIASSIVHSFFDWIGQLVLYN